MRFKKQLITLLGSNLNVSTVVAADAAVNSNTTTTTTEPEKKTYKWTYPFKACDKYCVRPMSKAQTFGMTDYMRFVNPPSYFHDGWDFGHSEVGYSPVYAIYENTVKKVAYGSGLGWFIWVISPDKYVEIYQEGFNNKSDIYIKAGQKIGKSTGSHLHLGLTKTTKKYINKNGFPCNNWNVNNGTWLNPISTIKKYLAKQK